jgi:PncC family amidohydrolase
MESPTKTARGDLGDRTGPGSAAWDGLYQRAARVAERLVARRETVAIAESSAGGLISAALLAVPGASAYFRGGAVVYTVDAKMRLLGQPREAVTEPRAATEAHALVLARAVRAQLDATWGLGETGATGPTGNRYGDPPGHACVGVAGPARADLAGTASSAAAGQSTATGGGSVAERQRQAVPVEQAATLETGSAERVANMHAFAAAALDLFLATLAAAEQGA